MICTECRDRGILSCWHIVDVHLPFSLDVDLIWRRGVRLVMWVCVVWWRENMRLAVNVEMVMQWGLAKFILIRVL